MIHVHLEDSSGRLSEALVTSDLVEAEAHYLRLIQRRTKDPCGVVLQGPEGVLQAYYRLDAEWGGAPREQIPERQSRLWTPRPVETVGPGPEHVRGALLAAGQLQQPPDPRGVSQLEAARLLGVSATTLRTWVAPYDVQSRQQIGWVAWVALLTLLRLWPGE